MAGLNKIMVIGNVGKDPEMRYAPNGNPVTTFSIATNRNYTTAGGEKREETEWFSVVSWNNLAERVNQYVTKGKRVFVEGRLHSHTWQGQDGVTRFRNEIIANEVVFLDRMAAPEPGDGEDAGAPAGAATPAVEAEDLPF